MKVQWQVKNSSLLNRDEISCAVNRSFVYSVFCWEYEMPSSLSPLYALSASLFFNKYDVGLEEQVCILK